MLPCLKGLEAEEEALGLCRVSCKMAIQMSLRQPSHAIGGVEAPARSELTAWNGCQRENLLIHVLYVSDAIFPCR